MWTSFVLHAFESRIKRPAAVLFRDSARIVLLATFFLGMSRLALAERPPIPEDELAKGSDLIIEVNVLSVAKTGKRAAPVWLARLKIRKTMKGAPPANPMEYWFLPAEPSLAGGRNESVFAGQHLRLYLVREKSGHYVPWASNSIELLEHFDQKRYLLPKQFGEVIFADGGRGVTESWPVGTRCEIRQQRQIDECNRSSICCQPPVPRRNRRCRVWCHCCAAPCSNCCPD